MKIKPTIKGIGDVLYERRPNLFKTKKDARVKAKEIQQELKRDKKKVTIGNIMAYVKKKRKRKEEIPPLPPEMLSPNNYYILANYPDLILTEVDKRITLISKVSPKGVPPIKGGQDIDYYEYFADFVDYMNENVNLKKEQEGVDPGSDLDDWFVMCVLVDKEKNIYEIISCTEEEEEYLYGFDPNKSKNKPNKLIQTKMVKTKRKEEKKDISKKVDEGKGTKSDKDSEIELIREKRQLIKEKVEAIERLIKAGYTKKEARDIIEKLEMGGEI